MVESNEKGPAEADPCGSCEAVLNVFALLGDFLLFVAENHAGALNSKYRRDLAARVDSAGVAEQDDLQHHRRVVGRSSAAGVGGLESRAVHTFDDGVDHAHKGVFGDELSDGGREEHGLALHAGLELRSRLLSPGLGKE